MNNLNTLNIAFYRFFDLAEPEALREKAREFCLQEKILGTVIFSPEGINGSLAGTERSIRKFQSWIRSEDTELEGLDFKETWSEIPPFKKLFMKLKPRTIPMDAEGIRPHVKTGARLSPRELKSWYESGKDFVVVDTRNDYEYRLGHFRNSLFLGLRHFRKFPEKVQAIPEEIRKKPVVMFCTGGIRCEKATAFAEEFGFTEVYQLEGGILRYFEECGGAYYDGDCFVFDDRVLIGADLKIVPTVCCPRCEQPFAAENFQNCTFCPEETTAANESGLQCQVS